MQIEKLEITYDDNLSLAPERTMFTMSNRGISMVNMDNGKSKIVPFKEMPLAVAVDSARRIIFVAKRNGIFRMEKVGSGIEEILY